MKRMGHDSVRVRVVQSVTLGVRLVLGGRARRCGSLGLVRAWPRSFALLAATAWDPDPVTAVPEDLTSELFRAPPGRMDAGKKHATIIQSVISPAGRDHLRVAAVVVQHATSGCRVVAAPLASSSLTTAVIAADEGAALRASSSAASRSSPTPEKSAAHRWARTATARCRPRRERTRPPPRQRPRGALPKSLSSVDFPKPAGAEIKVETVTADRVSSNCSASPGGATNSDRGVGGNSLVASTCGVDTCGS